MATVPYKFYMEGKAMNGAKLDKIFKPKSIAVIGASETIGTAGYRIFQKSYWIRV